MNNTFPIYDIVIDDDSLGMTAISLVDYPAIMTDFIAFRKVKEEKMIWMSKGEKREIVSPILIPNQLILRQDEQGNFYYIRWTKKTIEKAAEKYLANGFFNNFTVLHPTFYNKDMKYTDALEKDVYMLRMWTIDDPSTDDANTKYGFNLPEGTLMVHLKVHNRSIWQKIRSKELRGLSIEAFTNMVRSDNDLKLRKNMSKLDVNEKQMNLFQKFIQFLNEVSSEAADIADIAKKDSTDSGDVTLKYFIDDEHFIEVDAEGFARDEEYNLVAEGEYKLADGNILVVNAENKFVETKAAEEVEDENQPVEAPIAEKKLEDEDEDEGKDKNVEGEPDGETDNVDPEGNADGSEKDTETPTEATDEIPTDEPIEEPVEEPTEEPPLALIPFEIDGVEYLLPQEVVDYINSLKGEGDSVKAELMQMKERMPSATPIPNVINQSATEKETEELDLFSAVRLLNTKR